MLRFIFAGIVCVSVLGIVYAQPSPDDLAPLLQGLNNRPSFATPPSIKQTTEIPPLVNVQLNAPPIIPKNASSCTVKFIVHRFANSYGQPAIVPYTPPMDSSCGPVGKWAAITMNITMTSVGRQYDRLAEVYLSGTEIWRTSTAEPTKNGIIFTTVKDVTHFAPLFAQSGSLMFDLGNLLSDELGLDGIFDAILSATFYAPTPNFLRPSPADIIIPLSNLSPITADFFSIENDVGAVTQVTLPPDAAEAYIEVFCSGNSLEEFWYLNTPDEFIGEFTPDAGLVGKGPFREVQVLVNNKAAGFVWPYPVIYTGGITPTNWRPISAYGSFDAPSYWIDITPFIPSLLTPSSGHNITFRVLGQGRNPSFNPNWFVSGSIHVRRGTGGSNGSMKTYQIGDLDIKTTGGIFENNGTVWTKVVASRNVLIETEFADVEGAKKTVRFSQELTYSNDVTYQDNGFIQSGQQLSEGLVLGTHGGKQVIRDAFSYPIDVFANYSGIVASPGSFFSTVDQTFRRALQPPTDACKTILSIQHAQGAVLLDKNGHVGSGTGSTNQTLAYIDCLGGTYFRDSAAGNATWVHDYVWGNLKDLSPAVPVYQIVDSSSTPGFTQSDIAIRPGPRGKRHGV